MQSGSVTKTSGTIIAVCSSRKKGTRKTRIAEGIVEANYGLKGDAHANSGWHRQVSLLSMSSIAKMRALGLDVGPGDFAENFTIDGMDVVRIPVGTQVAAGNEVILEITQIGKECHTRCAIYHQVGQCAMPEEGVFARVIRGGTVRSGDTLRVIGNDENGSHRDAGMQAKSS